MHIHTLLDLLLHYEFFKLASSHLDEEEKRIIINIAPRKNSKLLCSHCHQEAPQYDTLHTRDFDFIPYLGLRVVFRYRMRRVRCPHCGDHVYVEEVPWASGKSPMTNELKALLAEEAKTADTVSVAERYDMSWGQVNDAIEEAVGYGLKTRDLSGVTQIGIDEIAWHVGHHYITLVYQLDKNQRRLLWIGKDRKKSTLHQFFDDMEQACPGFASRLKVACTDMWKAYMSVLAERAPQALNLLDRFHIVKMANDAVNKVRREDYAELKKIYPDLMKNSKYCFLKNPQNLTEKQAIQITELRKINCRPCTSYILKEQLRLMWETCENEIQARLFLKKWITAALKSRIKQMRTLANIIRRRMELILNYFRVSNPPSSGVVEGLNRKVNLSIRKSFGLRFFKTAKVYLLHQLGDLKPLPYTHKFS